MMRMRCTELAMVCALAFGCCMAIPALGAGPVPDIKGKWVGKTYSIVAGMAPHWPSNQGTFEKPGLFEKDLVIEITGQDGRRFWGMQSFSGSGEETKEPMIGELTGRDNRTLVLVDTDGYLNGHIDGTVLSFCYTQAGGKTNSSVVSCSELKRAPAAAPESGPGSSPHEHGRHGSRRS
jgi:hypothetical protein